MIEKRWYPGYWMQSESLEVRRKRSADIGEDASEEKALRSCGIFARYDVRNTLKVENRPETSQF